MSDAGNLQEQLSSISATPSVMTAIGHRSTEYRNIGISNSNGDQPSSARRASARSRRSKRLMSVITSVRGAMLALQVRSWILCVSVFTGMVAALAMAVTEALGHHVVTHPSRYAISSPASTVARYEEFLDSSNASRGSPEAITSDVRLEADAAAASNSA